MDKIRRDTIKATIDGVVVKVTLRIVAEDGSKSIALDLYEPGMQRSNVPKFRFYFPYKAVLRKMAEDILAQLPEK